MIESFILAPDLFWILFFPFSRFLGRKLIDIEDFYYLKIMIVHRNHRFLEAVFFAFIFVPSSSILAQVDPLSICVGLFIFHIFFSSQHAIKPACQMCLFPW